MEIIVSSYFGVVIGWAIGQAIAEIQNGVFKPLKND